MISTIIILGALLLVFVAWPISIYNKLVTYRNRVRNGFSQIDVQLKRRYDLIPNLLETVKGYMKHERETLEAVIQARNQAIQVEKEVAETPEDGESIQKLMGTERALSSSLGKLFALSESYPDLKANENMMQLTEELSSTENKIAFARQAFNDAVMQYNTAREVFPSSLIANSFGFKSATQFELDNPETERAAPKISFD